MFLSPGHCSHLVYSSHYITSMGLGKYPRPSLLHTTQLQASAGQTSGGKARSVSPSPALVWHKLTPSLCSGAGLGQAGPRNAGQEFKGSILNSFPWPLLEPSPNLSSCGFAGDITCYLFENRPKIDSLSSIALAPLALSSQPGPGGDWRCTYTMET